MARGKGEGLRGASGGSRHRRGGLRSPFVTSGANIRQDSYTSHPLFSLRDEARNTERHQSWNSDRKLRHTQINFVSAGDLEQSSRVPPTSISDRSTSAAQGTVKETVPERAMADMHLDTDVSEEQDSKEGVLASSSRTISPRNGGSIATAASPANADNGNLFVIDTEGSRKLVLTGFASPKLRRSLSPTASDSSEEVIVFAGRNRSPLDLGDKQFSGHKSNSLTLMSPDTTEPSVIHANPPVCKPKPPIHSKITFSASGILTSESQPKAPAVEAHAGTHHVQIASTVNGTQRKTGEHSRHRRKRGTLSTKRRLEEELLDDYIANIDDSDDMRSSNVRSEMKGCDNGDVDLDEWQDDTGESATERQIDAMLEGAPGSSATDVQNLDELSTSDELLEAIEHILSKRERASGIQYLVIWKGYTIDDARWIPLTSLTMPGAEQQIQQFEAEENLVKHYSSSYGSSDESLDDDERLAMDLDEDLEDLKDGEDLLKCQKARLTDEQIARLLSKQDELGFGSDELMLFDGFEGKQGDLEGIPEILQASMTVADRRVTAKKKKPPLRGFTSATAFADVLDQDPYNGFDIMDHERPSLRKRPKGRRGVQPFQLADSALEISTQSVWEQDRSKKKMRKQEREGLRAQGLLGKKGKLDMKAKYAEGMSLEEIKGEIRDFLVTPNEMLPLPPMDKHDRKIVHEIANVLHLKSKSVGGGRSRYPVLYKTSRTSLYSEEALGVIESRSNQRRFVPRMDKARKRGAAAPRGGAGRGGGFAGAAVSYRDGEVVGATAPEIGAENKGRAMLERMGWSTGTALGALNNKGIMQPVVHVVKTTKAGLG